MISVIICSRTPDISAELRENIDSTCGMEHEIIVIDNSHNEYSIFSAYNEGVRRAKGDVLCFMHDDVLFHTERWGEIMEAHFANSMVGLVGFAGTHFMPSCSAYWYDLPFISEHTIGYEEGVKEERFQIELFKDNLNSATL